MPVITYFEDDDGDKLEVKEGRLWYNNHAIADAREFADFLQSELAKDAPVKPDADDWIEWSGGPCPVDPNASVDLTTRNGVVLVRRKAGLWDWRHDGVSVDIMRYRPAKGGAE